MGTDEIGMSFGHSHENGNLVMAIVPLNRSPIKFGMTEILNYPCRSFISAVEYY